MMVGGGCQQLGYLGYLVAPEPPTKEVDAEFKGLDNHRVAIVIFADQRTQYEYPFARLTLASVIKAELSKRLKAVSVVDPARVCRYQEEHINWESLEKTELGKALGADFVFQVNLMEYTTREPGSVDLFRGRITGQNSLYQVSLNESDARVWRSENITIVFPQNAPAGIPAGDDMTIRQATEQQYAETLVKKFYKHKAPKEEDGS